jgi:hypothetical protein
VTCLLSHEHTVPAIVSVCPNAIPPIMHPATTAHVKTFTFMLPLNSQRLAECKLFTCDLVRGAHCLPAVCGRLVRHRTDSPWRSYCVRRPRRTASSLLGRFWHRPDADARQVLVSLQKIIARASTAGSVMSSEVETSLVVTLYCFGGSGIVLSPTRARYSSAWRRSFPARSMILSRLSIDETSSSCSVRNHCRKLIVM